MGRRGQAHRIDCANNVCGNADTVNKVLCIVVVAISYQDLMLRGGETDCTKLIRSRIPCR